MGNQVQAVRKSFLEKVICEWGSQPGRTKKSQLEELSKCPGWGWDAFRQRAPCQPASLRMCGLQLEWVRAEGQGQAAKNPRAT